MPLMPLPTDPMPAVSVLLSYLTGGGKPELKEVGHAALHLAAYGYGLYDSHPPMSCSSSPAMGREEAVRCLELLESHGGRMSSPLSAIDWPSLIAFLVQLALQLLRPQPNPA